PAHSRVIVIAIHRGFIDNARSVSQKLMRSHRADSRVQAIDVLADGLVQLEFSLLRKSNQGGRGKHLGRRADAKQHVGGHRRSSFDLGYPEGFGIDQAVAAYYCDGRAWSVVFLQLFEEHSFELSEVGVLFLETARRR